MVLHCSLQIEPANDLGSQFLKQSECGSRTGEYDKGKYDNQPVLNAMRERLEREELRVI